MIIARAMRVDKPKCRASSLAAVKNRKEDKNHKNKCGPTGW
jgi:hypothetical protein